MFTLLAMSAGEITGIIIACVVVLALIAVIFGVLPVRIWFRALVSGVKVPMARLIGMKWRGVKVATIVDAYISASKAGLNVTIDELETHVLAKGDAIKVVNALISAHSANIKLEPRDAAHFGDRERRHRTARQSARDRQSEHHAPHRRRG